ncbi:maleylpyruvate isomerase family mycothiol-dependent enzyme [Actinocrinis puniceicyclus]|uniref:Maleylpyruvate isomerase family mycothiol-dependent enzyme n=1 Tax=Actinocrinis puniceicyclus TaxID=977794 RepID=A0A8J7WUM5_9ACTN|nr:maleylpyruvate isomerase family mycothiol-dependent enzyme [Actinocrinis puniceicyclus]MBS2966090.1 maleylpyruvate isomerase family mycothiol-dependent enzyme [Actinocrinis puniceicyclus]
MSIDEFYCSVRLRIRALIDDLPSEAHAAPVPACPGWRVRDVVAHLAATAEDAVAGRLAGVPDEQHTADQVARFRDLALEEVLGRWEAAAPGFERVIAERGIWAGAADIVSHEHDIRGAVGRPGARDSEAVRAVSDWLLRFKPPVPLTVEVEDARFELGGPPPDALTLRTTRWEAVRWRTGRRSRAQMAAMDWSDDPAAVLDHLAVFGPAAHDLIE